MTEVKQVEFKDNETIIKDGKLYKLVEQPKKLLISEGAEFYTYEEYGCPRITSNFVFTDSQYTEDFMDALDVFLELKRCDGACDTTQDAIQYTIGWVGNDYLTVDWGIAGYLKTQLFPCFKDRKSCEAAIAKVGSERIIKAANTWHRLYK